MFHLPKNEFRVQSSECRVQSAEFKVQSELDEYIICSNIFS